MELLLFLLLLILTPILYSIVKVWLAVRKAQRQFQETYRDMRDAYNRAANGENGSSATKKHKKPEGEYAEFEEIDSSSDDTVTNDTPSQQDSEPLVMEAEFEDIN